MRQSLSPAGAGDERLNAAIAELVDRNDEWVQSPETARATRSPLTRYETAIVLVAAAKVVTAFVVMLTGHVPPGVTIPAGITLLEMLAFGGAAGVLLLAHAGDRRTANLGAVLLLVASAYTVGLLSDLAAVAPPAAFLVPLYPDAFFPFFLGSFIQEFPRRRGDGRWDRVLAMLVRVSLVAGIALFACNVVLEVTNVPAVERLLGVTARRSATGTFYWTVLFGLALCQLPLAFTGLRNVDAQEQRRVKWFLAGFIGGLTPLVGLVVLGGLPVTGPWLASATTLAWVAPVVWFALASVPVTVSYALLVRNLLPLRVIVRNGLGYLLARGTVTAAFVIPSALLVIYGYLNRNETIATALAGRGGWLLAGVGITGVVVIGREWLLRTVDRAFFRERYDAREILINLTERSQRIRQLDELVALVTAGVDRAFQPDHLAVLVRDQYNARFLSPFSAVEPLPAESLIVRMLEAVAAPVHVRLSEARSPMRWLPRRERQWLVDSGASLLVPVRTTEDTLVGVIALGDRRNEEPYTREDLRLLRAIADTGALVIEHQAMRTSEPALAAVKGRQVGFDARSDRAAECSSCGSVYQGGSRSCTSCDRPLEAAAVPYVLLGKFRFERRVGRGGMGIVYRAIDLALDRAVAIKTLPGASPERAQRLRHEAKAMAAVTHQHLASIYGLEAWRGQPLLVCEYMTGGTLADRLEKGSLPIQEALTLGVQLAEALDVVHRADLLHRDIKPSNIGYLDRATPKLLDFGLVHMLLEARVEHAVMGDQAPDSGQQPFLSSLSVSRGFVGTPLYLSPEAARGEAPSTAFDLWSLNVLLLEAIIGRHPFRGRSLQDTLDRIGQADLQGVLTALQHRAPRVAGYFERALARSASNRPPSARDVAGEIRRLVS